MIHFKRVNVPFENSNQFSQLFLDYVSESEKIAALYSFPPTASGYNQAANSLQYNEAIRPVLIDVIKEQYAATGISVSEKLLNQLAAVGALTVCTGHQLCLFTGPLYFIYKICTTIKVAEEQSRLLGKNTIPVYWMATEDHDFEEISAVNIFGKTLKWAIGLTPNEKVPKGAVGDISTDSLDALLSELKILLGDAVAAQQLYELIAKAYRPGRTLTQATREFVNELFFDKIIIIDGNDKKLKSFFRTQLKQEVEWQQSFQFVSDSILQIEKLGYVSQVNPRRINLFYLQNNFRERIEEKDGIYNVLNSTIFFTKEQLLIEIENSPEKFSPNVVLRPLYQQIILPNIAYIGGPGEIAYWLQYKTMFDHFKVAFPVLQPRHFAVISDKKSVERLLKFEIAVEELFGDLDELIKLFVHKNSGDSLSFAKEQESLRELFASVRSKIVTVDFTLAGAVDAELQKQLNVLENLESKVLRAAKHNQEISITQLRKLHNKFFPNDTLQERYENFIPFYLQHGPDLISMLEREFELPVEGVLVLS